MKTPQLRLTLLILALTLLSCAGPMGYKGIAVRYPTLMALAREGAEFRRETAWCLIGRVKDGVVIIDEVSAPVIKDRTEVSVVFSGCIADDVVGWFHNHPSLPFDTCEPSDTDVATTNASEQFKVMLLSCTGNSFIYRLQGDSINYRIDYDEYIAGGKL